MSSKSTVQLCKMGLKVIQINEIDFSGVKSLQLCRGEACR